MTQSIQIANTTASGIIDEIEQAFFDIPFENSDFQTEAFVLAAQITPERAYRALGLRMMHKLQALQENHFQVRKSVIDVMELQEKIDDPATSKFDKMRAELEVEKIQGSQSYAKKLVNDAIHDLEVMYNYFQTMPRFTRNQFEAAERNHFEQRLARQVKGITGAAESVLNMTVDMPALATYTSSIPPGALTFDDETLNHLRLSMGNQQNLVVAAPIIPPASAP